MQNLMFEISGELINADIEGSQNKNDEYTLSVLLENRERIAENIREEIYYSLKKNNQISKFIKIYNINVQIEFEKGSILTTGLIVIDYMGKVAGGISFFEYLAKLIKWIITRNIRNSINRYYKININVNPVYIDEEKNNINKIEEHSVFWGITPAKILLSITLINIMLFLGGVLFNAIQVPSIIEKYDEAKSKIADAKAKLDSTDKILNNSQSLYFSNLENNQIEINKKKTEIINSLSADTINIKAEAKNVSIALTNLESKLYVLNDDVIKSDVYLTELNSYLTKLKDEEYKIGFLDIWKSMDWLLRSLLILGLLNIVIVLVMFIKWKRY